MEQRLIVMCYKRGRCHEISPGKFLNNQHDHSPRVKVTLIISQDKPMPNHKTNLNLQRLNSHIACSLATQKYLMERKPPIFGN
jgi:hypothetical protein